MAGRFMATKVARNSDPRLIEAEDLCREFFINEEVEGLFRSMCGRHYSLVIFQYNFPASMNIIFTSDQVKMIVRYPNGAAEAVDTLREKLKALFPEKEVTSYWP